MLNYSYANESFGKTTGRDLLVDSSAFQVSDDEGNVVVVSLVKQGFGRQLNK